MHIVAIIMKTGAEYQFFFKDKQKALKFKNDFEKPEPPIVDGLFHIVDEYHKEGIYQVGLIGGIMVMDLEKKAEVESEVALISARADARLQNAAKSDPVLNGIRGLAVR